MSKFLTKLVTENLHETDDQWQMLTEDLRYQSDKLNTVLVINKGFITDFASVPRLPIIFALFGDTSKEAATVHDYLRRTLICSRETADAVFLEASKATRVPGWRRNLMWAAVRVFGWIDIGKVPTK